MTQLAIREAVEGELVTNPVRATNSNVLTVREIYADMDKVKLFATALSVGGGCKPDEAMAKIIVGSELEISPAAAVRGIHFISGRIALSADLMVALAKDEGWKIKVEHSSPPGKSCRFTASKPGEEPYSFEWTMEMAKTAGLGGANWTKYPWDMLYARCAAHVCRKVCPGRLSGMYTTDEAEAMPVLPAHERQDAANSAQARLKALSQPKPVVQEEVKESDAQETSADTKEDDSTQKSESNGTIDLMVNETFIAQMLQNAPEGMDQAAVASSIKGYAKAKLNGKRPSEMNLAERAYLVGAAENGRYDYKLAVIKPD